MLSPKVQVGLYRIVQEALSNTMRHAAATRIDVYLNCEPEHLELHIRDNGRGFAVDRVRPGHLGLGIMQDRARSIGAILRIESEIGQGTHIAVVWNADKEATHHA